MASSSIVIRISFLVVPVLFAYRGLVYHYLSPTTVISITVSTWYILGGLEYRGSMVAVG